MSDGFFAFVDGSKILTTGLWRVIIPLTTAYEDAGAQRLATNDAVWNDKASLLHSCISSDWSWKLTSFGWKSGFVSRVPIGVHTSKFTLQGLSYPTNVQIKSRGYTKASQSKSGKPEFWCLIAVREVLPPAYSVVNLFNKVIGRLDILSDTWRAGARVPSVRFEKYVKQTASTVVAGTPIYTNPVAPSKPTVPSNPKTPSTPVTSPPKGVIIIPPVPVIAVGEIEELPPSTTLTKPTASERKVAVIEAAATTAKVASSPPVVLIGVAGLVLYMQQGGG